jgi:hypothetical protein
LVGVAGCLMVIGMSAYVEDHYRFWDWYKAGRVAAEPGLVFFVGLLVMSISHLVINWQVSLEQWVSPVGIVVAIWGILLRNRRLILNLFRKKKLG